MSKSESDRATALSHPLLNMTPEDAERWVRKNTKNIDAIRELLIDLVKAVNAIANAKQ